MKTIFGLFYLSLSTVMIMNIYSTYTLGVGIISTEIPSEGISLSIILDLFIGYYSFKFGVKKLFTPDTIITNQ